MKLSNWGCFYISKNITSKYDGYKGVNFMGFAFPKIGPQIACNAANTIAFSTGESAGSLAFSTGESAGSLASSGSSSASSSGSCGGSFNAVA